MKIHTMEQKLTVDNRDPREAIAMAELQVEFLQRRVQDLLDELEKCRRIVELSGKSES